MKVIVEYVEDEADGRGPSGGVKKIPVVVFRGPAELRPLGMKEILAGGGVQAELTHRLSLRYRPEVKPTGRFKLVGTDRLFEIASIINVDERNQILVCLVIERG